MPGVPLAPSVGLVCWLAPLSRTWFLLNLSCKFKSTWLLPPLDCEGWRLLVSVVRRGSAELPFVVAVAVEGKKLALPPALTYEV